MTEKVLALGIDPSGAQAGARKFVSSLDDIEKGTKKAANQNDIFGRTTKTSMNKAAVATTKAGQATTFLTGKLKLMAAGLLATVTAGAAAIASISRLSNEYFEFNKRVGEVSTLIEGTPEQLEFIEGKVRDLAAAYGGPATAQIEAFYTAISAGAPTVRAAAELVDQANKLAVGGVTDVQTALDGLTTVLNVYGKEAGTVTDVTDSMFVAMRAGKTTISELSAGYGILVSNAKVAGLSFDDVNAAIAGLTKTGLSTNVAFTRMNSLLDQVIKPTKEAAEAAKLLGIDFSLTGLRAKGLAGFIDDIKTRTAGAPELLGKLFTSSEALQAAIKLSGSAGREFTAILEQMTTKAGATDEAFGKIAETLDNRYNRAVERIKNVLAPLGEATATAVTNISEVAATSLESIVATATSVAQRAAVEFEFLSTVVVSGYSVIGNTIASAVIEAMNFMVQKVKEGLNVIIEGLNLVIGAANLVGASFSKIELFDANTPAIENTFKDAGTNAGTTFANAVRDALQERTASLNEIALQGVNVEQELANGMENFKNETNQANESLKAIPPSLDDIKAGAAAANDALKAQVAAAKEQASFIKGQFTAVFSQIRSGLREGENFWESFGNAAISVLDNITDRLLNQVLDAIFQVNEATGQIGGGGGNFLSSILSGFGGTTATVSHAGGKAGVGPKRRVPSAVFAGAPRLHNGSLAPDERPTILQTGEVVLSRSDVAAARAGGRSPGSERLDIRVAFDEDDGFRAFVDKRSTRNAGLVVQQTAPGIVNESRSEMNNDISSGRADNAMTRFGVAPRPKPIG